MPSRPITLYKYKDISGDGIEHLEDLLRSNRVWFSSPIQFNDPFDCRCVFEVGNSREEVVFRKATFLCSRESMSMDRALEIAQAEIPHAPHEVEAWQERQIEDHSRRAANTGIFCLTALCDNFTMWTHYARNHTGVCIQFRVAHEANTDQIKFITSAHQVEYADRCPVINFVRERTADIVRKCFFTKATPFRYEKEWRIVQYDQSNGLKEIPKGIVGAVILGCQVDAASADRIKRACANYDGDIEIVRAHLDPELYGLSFEKICTV